MTRSLTKRDSNGKTYERPAEIEAAIRSAEQQDAVTLSRRAAISDRSSPDFMPSECLVYLIREGRRREDEEMMNVLLLPLLARCEANLRTKVPNGGILNAADVREDILSEFSVLFAEDGFPGHLDELDYYECRFNAAFRSLRIDIVRRELTRARQRAKQVVPVPTEDEAPDNSGDDEVLARIAQDFRQNPTQLPRLFLEELLSAIKSLPEDERNAVVLCHILGYKEESQDALERTAATICGVSGRTIRNRLGRAAAKLSHLKFKKEA